ncbi:putative clathrin assembly protein [Hibiscus syriacus]|uniref:Clathrin assembly protein n=1 Tax=Hibiscus syriacus TaxID=106335 RepID=A0A6A3C336_HIBSY|nr:putative clathrin assembly protein At1g03050 [Hibiscus syriacus]XP_039061957.1 putative clathrin assembly protein At1g03050 [Hibiscus syriacus]XP_039061958.1 putative clathrin assembly protein At1g03050 [Hibiscus syriacus]KAE8722737.1 putative clathrin assembly protein [Hibiscus syriacus]
MAPSKIRRAIGHVKDQTSISLAKVGNSSAISDLTVAIVKATRHEEYPAEERHIREILSLTSYSRSHIRACVKTLSKRLNKTRNWTVALKTLMLIQRLLSDGDAAYQQEFFLSTRRGTRILNMSDFRDTSQFDSWDFTAFVRTYALYLDERLEYVMEGKFGGRRSVCGSTEDDQEDNDDGAIVVRSVPVAEMKTEHLFSRLLHLQQLLDRFLSCRPIGSAKCNRVVTVALHPIVKESFQIYYDITEILGVLIDRFMELDMSYSIKIYNIFCRERKQFVELENFHSWCKSVGIARSSDYPVIQKITQNKLDIIDEFILDKSALEQTKMFRDEFGLGKETETSEEEEEDEKEIKALPEPNHVDEEPEHKKEEEVDNSKALVVEQMGDLLNLRDDSMSQDYGDRLALALFDGYLTPVSASAPSSGPGWEAFKDDTDWESALVQSASNLKNQTATLGGGFDLLLLDSMYQQGANMAAIASPGYATTGSASSVAFGSVGRPVTLALPAPPSSKHIGTDVADPFTASLALEPPSYVQMSDMEKKQRFLVEEQAMWEQYRRDGVQGYGAMAKVHNYPYSPGYSPWYGY